MMVMVRVPNETIRASCGEGNVTTWLQKIKLVARLRGIDDLAGFIPLYLDGLALVLYLEWRRRIR